MDTLSAETRADISRYWAMDADPLATLAQRFAIAWRRRKRECILSMIGDTLNWVDTLDAPGRFIETASIRLLLIEIKDIV